MHVRYVVSNLFCVPPKPRNARTKALSLSLLTTQSVVAQEQFMPRSDV
jgi:hypothetical protein